MSWDQMRKAKEESEKNSIFIKLKDGEAVEGVFRGDPYTFYSKFKDPIEYKDWAEGRSFKFKINFITREDGKPVSKIFQGGATLRDLLIDAIDEYGMDCVFKIKRTGSSKDDTRYSVLFKTNLTPEQVESLRGVELHPLDKKKARDEPPSPGDDDVPWN